MERYAEPSYPYSCILELRARIEALEAAQQPRAFTGQVVAPITRDRDETGNYLIVHDTPAPASLVQTVARLIASFASTGLPGDDATTTARAAILEAAAWLTENYARDVASPPPCQMLRNEVNR
jgi:hypothetical protein